MYFKKLIITSILLAVPGVNAYAKDYISGEVHHPIHIKKLPAYSGANPLGISPQQIKHAYTIDQVVAEGKGQVIGIIDAYDHPNIESDLAIFNNMYNLAACNIANGCFQKIYADNVKPRTDAGWAAEIALDVEWAHAIAPQAKIMLVEADSNSLQDMLHAVQVAVNNGANIISMSWGAAESAAQFNTDNLFKSPAVTFIAASGDSGYGVSYPASSPFVIGVGGTTLYMDAAGNRRAETAWSGSGGGLSRYEPMPAYQQSYPIPNNPQQKRGVPDVAYNANPNTGYAYYNSIRDVNGHIGWGVVGGTSAGAPQWAGIIAIANSIRRTSIPEMGALIYKLAKNRYDLTFYDIIYGKNGDCGYYCQANYNYDYVTGLGSPHALYTINMIIRKGELTGGKLV